MDVWDCDLVDVQVLRKYNARIEYLLSVIDVFSKYRHVVPLKTKTGPTVTAAFQSDLKDRRYSKPVRRGPPGCRWIGKGILEQTVSGHVVSLRHPTPT